MVLRLCFRAEPMAVRAALAELRRALAADPAPVDADIAELVLAEALNNVVEHACGGRGGRIALEVRGGAGGLCCTITDDGGPLPVGAPPPGRHPADSSETPPDGGFGWFLIRTLAGAIRYSREGGRNRLTFRIGPEQFAASAGIVSQVRNAPQ